MKVKPKKNPRNVLCFRVDWMFLAPGYHGTTDSWMQTVPWNSNAFFFLPIRSLKHSSKFLLSVLERMLTT